MISLNEINKRKIQLESYNHNNYDKINFDLLIKRCQNGKDIKAVETLIENWRGLNIDSDFALIETLNYIDKFCENCLYISDKKKVLSLTETMISTIPNLKRNKKNIENFFIKHDSERISSVIEEVDIYLTCDRVLNNQQKLNKINFDNIIKESNIYGDDNKRDCIYKLCSLIDSLKINEGVKYNLALENTMYSFDKLGMHCSSGLVLEAVNDYFLFKKEITDSTLDNMRFVLKENKLLSKEDIEDAEYIFDNDDLDEIQDDITSVFGEATNNLSKRSKPVIDQILNKFKISKIKTPESLKNVVIKIYSRKPDQIIDGLPNFFSVIRRLLVFSTIAINPILGVISICTDSFISLGINRSQADKAIAEFKKEISIADKEINKTKDDKLKGELKAYKKKLEKGLETLNEYADSLYTSKEQEARWTNESTSIVDEIIKLHDEEPISIKDYFISYHRSVIDTINKACKNLMIIAEKEYPSIVKNSILNLVDRDELNKFVYCNDKSINRFLDTDNKILLKIAYFLPLDYSDKITPYVNDNIRDILSDLCDTLDDTLGTDFCCFYDGNEDLYYIALSFNIPISTEEVDPDKNLHDDIIDEAALILAIEESMKNISDELLNDILSIIDDDIYKLNIPYITDVFNLAIHTDHLIDSDKLIDIFNECKKYVDKNVKDNNKYKIKSVLNEGIYNLSKNRKTSKYINPIDSYIKIENINEALSALRNYNTLNESSFAASIQVASQRLKKAVLNLSDKEKMASRSLDSSLERFQDKVQMSLAGKNREAVIKGSILPSASNTIKIAVAAGAAWAVAPALAVIGVLGGIAASKFAKSKERQFILDEIDIQLKIVDKKIQLAESNNDMKSMEELLKIQKKLTRERQRIHYHLKAYYPASRD